jgi:hypothetical protein
MATILQTSFESGKQMDEHSKIEYAKFVASQPGLRWKVWLNDAAGEPCGGVYLFDDLQSAKAWGDEILPKRLIERGAKNLLVRYFEANIPLSLITHSTPLLHTGLRD